jgi:hypothetical protein
LIKICYIIIRVKEKNSKNKGIGVVTMKMLEVIKGLLQPKKVSKYTLYVGLNDKDTRKQEVTTEKAKRLISRILASNNIEGATFLKAEGLYTYITDNKTEKENTYKIEVLFATDNQIKNAIENIKATLNQETVAVVKEKVNSSLI